MPELLDWSISSRMGLRLVFIITMFCIEIPVFNANSVDHDQTPLVASDLNLHCLTMSSLWEARHK